MIFNNGFPASYQPMNYGFQPYQQQGTQMSLTNQPQQQQQMMTPPTIRAEIVQVDGEEAAGNYPVGAGSSQMMIARDDSAIFVKTAAANGQGYTLDVFLKRPPAPVKPPVDMGAYVTRDEMEERLTAILEAVTGKKDEAARSTPAPYPDGSGV